MIDDMLKFETEIYPRIWRSAFHAGAEARRQGLPRECNLCGPPFGHGAVLKVYLSAWEQGWDYYNPDFSFMIEGVRELHRLIALGMDDSPEGEVIRDETDRYWLNLSEEERELARNFSEELYAET